MGWRLWVSGKTVRKFTELPIYCQRQKCSPGNLVSGSIRFVQIFAAVRWRGGVKWEWGHWKWRFSLHSFTVFRTFYIHEGVPSSPGRYAVIGYKLKQNANEGCNICASFAGLVLCFIACFILLVIAPLMMMMMMMMMMNECALTWRES